MCRRTSFLKAIYSLNFLSISRGFCHHYKVPDGACMLKKCAKPGGSAAGTAPSGGCFFELRNPSNQINIIQPFRNHKLYQIFLPSPPHFYIWSFADRIFTFPADSWCGGNLGSGINDYSVREMCALEWAHYLPSKSLHKGNFFTVRKSTFWLGSCLAVKQEGGTLLWVCMTCVVDISPASEGWLFLTAPGHLVPVPQHHHDFITGDPALATPLCICRHLFCWPWCCTVNLSSIACL